jgi:hypothetical protein
MEMSVPLHNIEGLDEGIEKWRKKIEHVCMILLQILF